MLFPGSGPVRCERHTTHAVFSEKHNEVFYPEESIGLLIPLDSDAALNAWARRAGMILICPARRG